MPGGEAAVVMVPGLLVAGYLRPAMAALTLRGLDSYLAIPPGWPQMDGRREPAAPPAAGAAIASWLAAEGLHDVTLVGQSAGAPIVVHTALAEPARIRRVVLQGPVFDPGQRSLARALLHWAADMTRERPSLVTTEGPEWLRAGPSRIVRALRAVLRERLEDSVDHLYRAHGTDVHVVVGERDPLSSSIWQRALVRGAGRRWVMPGLPHSAPYSDPDGFASLIERLVKV